MTVDDMYGMVYRDVMQQSAMFTGFFEQSRGHLNKAKETYSPKPYNTYDDIVDEVYASRSLDALVASNLNDLVEAATISCFTSDKLLMAVKLDSLDSYCNIFGLYGQKHYRSVCLSFLKIMHVTGIPHTELVDKALDSEFVADVSNTVNDAPSCICKIVLKIQQDMSMQSVKLLLNYLVKLGAKCPSLYWTYPMYDVTLQSLYQALFNKRRQLVLDPRVSADLSNIYNEGGIDAVVKRCIDVISMLPGVNLVEGAYIAFNKGYMALHSEE